MVIPSPEKAQQTNQLRRGRKMLIQTCMLLLANSSACAARPCGISQLGVRTKPQSDEEDYTHFNLTSMLYESMYCQVQKLRKTKHFTAVN